MLREQEKTLCGDVLLISAFVSYVGYFTKKYRAELMEKYWIPYLEALKVSGCGAPRAALPPAPAPRGPRCSGAGHPTSPPWQVPIPTTPGLDPLSLLTDAADVAAWSNQGLPSDRTSTENATILCNTQRWPLVVDAQLQGIKWIKNKYREELKAIRLGQRRWVWGGGCPPPVPQGLCTPIRAEAPESSRGQGALQGLAGGHLPNLTTRPPSLPGCSYLDTIEQAVSEGHTLLIEDIGETVEPVLDHLLGRNTIKKGRSARTLVSGGQGVVPAGRPTAALKCLFMPHLHDSSWGRIHPPFTWEPLATSPAFLMVYTCSQWDFRAVLVR